MFDHVDPDTSHFRAVILQRDLDLLLVLASIAITIFVAQQVDSILAPILFAGCLDVPPFSLVVDVSGPTRPRWRLCKII